MAQLFVAGYTQQFARQSSDMTHEKKGAAAKAARQV
jgi:hypothetical protein